MSASPGRRRDGVVNGARSATVSKHKRAAPFIPIRGCVMTWLWTRTRPSGSGFLEMPCTYRICLWSIILAPPSSRDIWINPLSIIEGANPAHVAHAHIAHARARHRRARGSAIIRLDDRAPDPGQTIPADGISLLSIIHNRAFGMGSVIQ